MMGRTEFIMNNVEVVMYVPIEEKIVGYNFVPIIYAKNRASLI